LGITTSLNSQQIPTYTESEFIVVKLMTGNHNIIITSMYRLPSSDLSYMDNLNQAIQALCHSNPCTAVWIGRDINLPDIIEETEQIISYQYRQNISDSFLQTLANLGLEQIVNIPLRRDKILDIITTNLSSLVKHFVGMPSLSDHDVVFL